MMMHINKYGVNMLLWLRSLKTPGRLDSTDHVQLHPHTASVGLFVESVVTC